MHHSYLQAPDESLAQYKKEIYMSKNHLKKEKNLTFNRANSWQERSVNV